MTADPHAIVAQFMDAELIAWQGRLAPASPPVAT